MPAPANDNFASAELISGTSGTVGPVTMDAATVEGSEDNAFGASPMYQTIWYRWVAPSTKLVTFTTRGSLAGDLDSGDGDTINWPPFGALDTKIAVWTGSTLGSLTLITSGGDTGSNYYSTVTFTATEGTTYYFQVGVHAIEPTGGHGPYIGTAILSWTVQIDSPRLIDRRNRDFSSVSSYTPGNPMPIHGEGDAVVVCAGVSGDTATMTISAGWTELVSFTIPNYSKTESYIPGNPGNPNNVSEGLPDIDDDDFYTSQRAVDPQSSTPWTAGGLYKVWYKIATGYDYVGPTLTFDTTRSGWTIVSTLEGPIDVGLTEVTAVSHYAEETHFPAGPSISAYPDYHWPTVQTIWALSDAVAPSLTGLPDDYSTGTGGTGNGTGVAYAHRRYRVHTGVNHYPGTITASDNSTLRGTHYPPSASVSIAWYSQGEPDRVWHIGAQDVETGGSCQPAWDGFQYIYRLCAVGSGATSAGSFTRYDIGTDSWTTLTPPLVWREWGASAVFDGKVYVFAGRGGNNGGSGGDVKTTLVYDISSDSWSTGATMPRFRIGKLVSGIDSSVTDFDVDEDTSDLFTDGADFGFHLWIDDERIKVTADKTPVSGNVYTYHVARGGSPTSAVSHSADAEVDGGSYSAGLTGGYSNFAYAVASDTGIYVQAGFGMGTNEAVDNAFFFYNPAEDSWTQLARLPAGQDQGNLVIDGDGLVHAIGLNIDGVDSNEVVWASGVTGLQFMAHQRYNPDTDTWTVLPNIPSIDSRGRPLLDSAGRGAVYQCVSLYDPVTDEIVTHIFQNGANPGTGYGDEVFIERYQVESATWTADLDIDADPHYTDTGSAAWRLAFYYDMAGVGLYNGRRVFVYDDTHVEGFPGVIYYDINFFPPTWDVLSTVATIDHDLLIGVEEDQHHARYHHLDADMGPHTGGLFYKLGTHITDADFINPTDGMVGITYRTEPVTGKSHRMIWVRANGVWRGVEA